MCPLVKLNNPLMGTETSVSTDEMALEELLDWVKLNNPLMGTETFFIAAPSTFLRIEC